MTGSPGQVGNKARSTGVGTELDRINLHGISGYGHHGVFEFEREQGQRFVVDVTCWLDLSAAAASDDLTDTLDYGALTQAVLADIEGEPVNLIEALALRVARTCLESRRVETVQVTVHKPEAPIDLVKAARRHAEVADVAVTLTRSRTRD